MVFVAVRVHVFNGSLGELMSSFVSTRHRSIALSRNIQWRVCVGLRCDNGVHVSYNTARKKVILPEET